MGFGDSYAINHLKYKVDATLTDAYWSETRFILFNSS